MRTLGHTGVQLSALTLGTARLAATDREEAAATLARALERGINAIELDASDHRAVALVGEVLRRENAANRVHILARASAPLRFDLPSPHVHAGDAYPAARLRAETDALLAALGVERLALLQLHAWCPEWLGEGDWLDALQQLRAEGKIAGIGASLFDHDVEAGLSAVDSGALDAVQVMLNIFDPAATAGLLPRAAERGIGVIARAPLYYGALAGKTDGFAADDWRAAYFHTDHAAETRARVARLPAQDTAALALRFALSHPGVTTVAVGMTNRAQLDANLAATEQGPLDPATLAELRRHLWLV